VSVPVCAREQRYAKGYTLAELLITISIILILMGMIMTAAVTLRTRSRVKSTLALIEGMGTSLQLYNQDWGSFPPSIEITPQATDYSPDDGGLFIALNGEDGRGPVKNKGDATLEKHFQPYMLLGQEQIRKVDLEIHVVDAFGRELRYFNCDDYITDESARGGDDPAARKANREAAREQVHLDSFELYSLGPNGRFDAKQHDLVDEPPGNGRVDDAEEGDDVTNW
jgi:prepilin-type N-terminal cleavage/methylation domain-containing protein